MLRNAYGLTEHVDESYNEGAETDAAKGVCHGSAECASCRTARHTAGFASAEEPRAIYAGDYAVDGVLDPFGNPIAGKCYEHDQADDFGRGASSAAAGRASRIGTAVAGLVFDVDSYQSDGKPCAKGNGHDATDCAY